MNSRRDSIQVQAIHVEQHLIETEKKPVEPEERNQNSAQQKSLDSERTITSNFVFDKKLNQILRQVHAIHDKNIRQQDSRLRNPSSLRASPDIINHRHGDALLDQLQLETLAKDEKSIDTLGKINEIIEISEQVKNKKQLLVDIKKDPAVFNKLSPCSNQ